MKRSEITRKKTKRLSAYDREFEKMKLLVRKRSGGRCEVLSWTLNLSLTSPIIESCLAWSASGHRAEGAPVHHRKYRQRGGTNSLDNLLHVCQPCHDWIHAHGGFGQPANLLGLALSAGESEEL